MTSSAEDARLVSRIELALFAPEATRSDIEKLCAQAREHALFGVCVNSSRVELARSLLEETQIQIVSLVGFPTGAMDTDVKRYETEVAVDSGAHEVEAVINVGRLKEGDGRFVLREMRDIVEAADERPVKFILETYLLTRDELAAAVELAGESGARFVVTSSDWHVPDARAEEVAFLRERAGPNQGIKAAGNIRDAQTIQALVQAGAGRIGVTSVKALAGLLIQ
jgi:deoxyribose-phosphate aldolase